MFYRFPMLCLAATTIMGVAGAALAQPNVLAHWTLDQTLADASGNGVTLFESGDVPFGPGQFGSAAMFTNNGSNFLENANPVLDPGTGDFAVSLWYRTSITGNQSLLGKGIEAFSFDDQGYRIRIDGGNLQFRLLDDNNSTAQIPAPALDTWHHIVAQRDGDLIQLFLNGTEVASDLGNDSLDLSTGLAFTIGRRTAQSGAGAFTGSLDEIWVFDGALSDTQVSNLFSLNNPVPEPAVASLLALGLGLSLRRSRRRA